MVIKSSHEVKVTDVEQMVKWLASFGQSAEGGTNRLLYNEAWIEAQQELEQTMQGFGLATHFDAVGNLFGKLAGTNTEEKAIITGSHIDTVTNGGVYDGVYGIIASLLATQRLYQRYGSPKKTIEVLSLCEEEGSRFPITFWGSGNITGKYQIEDGERIKDNENTILLEAMNNAGVANKNQKSAYRNDIACFIELHIEQGKVLESTNKSIGAVSHIVGQRRFAINVIGESNHAGTTPMPLRRDAMAITAEIIHFITVEAKLFDPDLVATVGQLNTKPNTSNVIAGEVDFSLDIRHFDETILDQFYQKLTLFIEELANLHKMEINCSQWLNAKPVAMDKEMTKLVEEIATEQSIPYKSMISGAGHDAQMFGKFYPTALIFVPSKDGISHSPKEFTSKKDLENGVDILTELLYRLAY
ncbi:allantoate deiminase [Paraliobacillus zengyii]|uniref:allantoate deiminase n=1 Tax=Paraliobacillus TaxID=200903 RepID=UPI002FCD7112